MSKLTRKDLMTLEEYSEQRPAFRDKVIAHKKNRQVPVSEHTTLYFEDRLTIQYQIQEMLRIERIFEAAGIEEELDAYNALVPDGSNLKATFMIEYEDENERKGALQKLLGIEDKVWIQVDGFERVWAIADEDLDRENEVKTSAVHFLRFEFDDRMIDAAKGGASINIGIDHPHCNFSVKPVEQLIRDSLVKDFQQLLH